MTRADLRAMVWATAFAHEAAAGPTMALRAAKWAVEAFEDIKDSDLPAIQEKRDD